MIRESEIPMAQRWLSGMPSEESWTKDSRFELISLLLPSIEKSIDQIAITFLHVEATRTMIALERYHSRYEQFPATLAELIPEFLSSLPDDPVSGKTFGYRLFSNDPNGREYLLYSFGIDAIDNNGKTDRDNYLALEYATTNFDYILNPPRPEYE